MKNITYRQYLLNLASDLGIDDEEAGETEWAKYLTDAQLVDAIRRLRPDAKILDEFADDDVVLTDE